MACLTLFFGFGGGGAATVLGFSSSDSASHSSCSPLAKAQGEQLREYHLRPHLRLPICLLKHLSRARLRVRNLRRPSSTWRSVRKVAVTKVEKKTHDFMLIVRHKTLADKFTDLRVEAHVMQLLGTFSFPDDRPRIS